LKTHFSRKELLGLPGMPSSHEGIRKKAERERWPCVRNTGQGGGFVYPLAALPAETQAALLLRHKVATERANDTTALRPCVDHERFDRLPQSAKDEALRRATALDTMQHLVAQGLGKMQAVAIVAKNCGEHANTIRNWHALVAGVDRADWLPALAPRYAGRQATAECPIEAWDVFKADYLRNSGPAASACYERLQRIAGEKGWKLPSQKTLMRRLERELSPAAIMLARHGRELAARKTA
jgi:putative transposase